MTATIVDRLRDRRPALRLLVPFATAVIAATSVIGGGGIAYAAGQTHVFSYGATDDGYADAGQPNSRTGSQRTLQAGGLGGNRTVSYLKFQVPGLPGSVTGATLTLTRDASPLPSTVQLSTVSSGWSEGTLTARNAPPVGPVVGTARPAKYASGVSFNVSSVVRGPGVYAFALSAPGGTVGRFRARENPSGPVLSVTVRQPPPLSASNPQVGPTTSAPAPSPSASDVSPVSGSSSLDSLTSPAGVSPSPSPSGGSSCGLSGALVPTCGILWGAAAGAFTSTPTDQAARAWEQTSGRPASIYHAYHRGDELFPTSAEIAMARDPASPRLLLLNWKVAYGTTWANVATGGQDARIDREAAYIKANFPEKFFMVLHHEPENDVNATAGSGMTAANFAAMFRHTVQRLRADGVTNAVFVIAYMGYEPWFTTSWWPELYPGDDVVDWIGVDSYLNAKPASYLHGDFGHLLDRTTNRATFPGLYQWATTQHPGKPFMLAEWGVYEYPADPSQKANVFHTVLPELGNYPALKAMVYFDTPRSQNGWDTRIDSSAQSLAAFRQIAADPRFAVQVRQ